MFALRLPEEEEGRECHAPGQLTPCSQSSFSWLRDVPGHQGLGVGIGCSAETGELPPCIGGLQAEHPPMHHRVGAWLPESIPPLPCSMHGFTRAPHQPPPAFSTDHPHGNNTPLLSDALPFSPKSLATLVSSWWGHNVPPGMVFFICSAVERSFWLMACCCVSPLIPCNRFFSPKASAEALGHHTTSIRHCPLM